MGMRNVKTALAVVICVIISKLLKLEYSFYAAIAAIITMETTVFNSFIVGKNRMLGTLVGATVGFVCATLFPGNPLLCGIGIIIVIYLCNLLNWSKAVSIACIVFLAIMVNLNGKNPLMYSLNRILDTFIGIIVAVFINYTIFPPNHTAEIEDCCDLINENLIEPISQGKFILEEKQLKELSTNLKIIQNKIDMQENEFKRSKKENDKIQNIRLIKEIQLDVYNSLKLLKRLDIKHKEGTQSKELQDELNIISNYNIREINKAMAELKAYSNK